MLKITKFRRMPDYDEIEVSDFFGFIYRRYDIDDWRYVVGRHSDDWQLASNSREMETLYQQYLRNTER